MKPVNDPNDPKDVDGPNDANALELIAQLAVRLEECPTEALDAAIVDLLGELGPAGKADRACTFLRSADGTLVPNAHEWCAPGIAPQMERLQAVSVASLGR